MTRQEQRFYCVSCGELVTSPKAEIMFRTGFFRIVHPMCYCYTCSLKEDKLANESETAASSTYSYKLLLRDNAKVAELSHQAYPS